MPLVKEHSKKRKAILIIASLVWLLIIASWITFLLNGFIEQYYILKIVYIALVPLISVLFVIILMMEFAHKKELQEIVDENSYRLGKPSLFCDLGSFKKRIIKTRKGSNKYAEQYFFIMTPTNARGSNGLNPYIRILNGYIADYITDLFSKRCEYGKNKVVYGFARDRFCFYAFLSLKQVLEIVDDLSNAIYELAENHELKLYLSPHFGIVKQDGNCTFSSAFANASVALEYAEMHFEQYALFDQTMVHQTSLSEIKEISEALKKKEFVIYYQPKYSLNKKCIIGSEALVRWDSPTKGLLPPSKFIAEAEVGGLIHQIDMYVFDKVVEDLVEMRRNGIELLPVSINFSLYEFYSPDFVNDLKKKVIESGLPISLIQIEITETTSQKNNILATSILNKLRDFGFKILMDDFGSGFSNLLNLNTLPIDIVKIDKSYIDGITLDHKNKEVLKCLISMCKANGFEIIAEGVEKEEQVKVLKSINCDVIQGYYFSKPIDKEEYINLIKEEEK